MKGDGFRIRLTNRRNCWEWCGGDAARDMRIQRRHESNHIVTMADPGGGKTSLFMQHLDQIEERGETAIVYDPHQQFWAGITTGSAADLDPESAGRALPVVVTIR